MNTLIAFDPGGTTGWCSFLRPDGVAKWHVVEFGQFPVEHLEILEKLIHPEDIVVYELI